MDSDLAAIFDAANWTLDLTESTNDEVFRTALLDHLTGLAAEFPFNVECWKTEHGLTYHDRKMGSRFTASRWRHPETGSTIFRLQATFPRERPEPTGNYDGRTYTVSACYSERSFARFFAAAEESGLAGHLLASLAHRHDCIRHSLDIFLAARPDTQ